MILNENIIKTINRIRNRLEFEEFEKALNSFDLEKYIRITSIKKLDLKKFQPERLFAPWVLETVKEVRNEKLIRSKVQETFNGFKPAFNANFNIFTMPEAIVKTPRDTNDFEGSDLISIKSRNIYDRFNVVKNWVEQDFLIDVTPLKETSNMYRSRDKKVHFIFKSEYAYSSKLTWYTLNLVLLRGTEIKLPDNSRLQTFLEEKV